MKFLRKTNKTKILSIVALVVAIVGMSLGFAAFSTALTISSSATVTPDSATFGVKFSTSRDSLVEAPVNPSSKTDGITATDGVINNSANPILTNLSATFSEPGQYVEYTFYARNEGSYTAYLNNINFLGKKVCRGKTGTTESLVESACDSIKITAKIGENTYSVTTPISNHSLGSSEGEQIIVRLEYASGGVYVDGDFSITFPDVSLVYSTIDDSSMSGQVVRLESGSVDEEGSVVSIGNEQFYVIGKNTENDTVKLLAKYNLHVGSIVSGFENDDADNPPIINAILNPTGIQDESAAGALIDSVAYSYKLPFIGVTAYSNGSSDYNSSTVKEYVDNYKDYLISIGANISDVRLITKSEMEDLGCSGSSCSSAPSWALSTSYWTSTSSDSSSVYAIVGGGFFTPYQCNIDSYVGVRPVIEIPLSEFE